MSEALLTDARAASAIYRKGSIARGIVPAALLAIPNTDHPARQPWTGTRRFALGHAASRMREVGAVLAVLAFLTVLAIAPSARGSTIALQLFDPSIQAYRWLDFPTSASATNYHRSIMLQPGIVYYLGMRWGAEPRTNSGSTSREFVEASFEATFSNPVTITQLNEKLLVGASLQDNPFARAEHHDAGSWDFELPYAAVGGNCGLGTWSAWGYTKYHADVSSAVIRARGVSVGAIQFAGSIPLEVLQSEADTNCQITVSQPTTLSVRASWRRGSVFSNSPAGFAPDSAFMPVCMEINPNTPPVWTFEPPASVVLTATAQWFDPPTAFGYRFDAASPGLFTQVADFPPGYSQPFTLAVGGMNLGSFGPGQAVVFSDYAAQLGALLVGGEGVASFTVTGIAPLADPLDPLGFAIKLAFSINASTFTMTPLNVASEWGYDINADGLVDHADLCAWDAQPIDLDGDGMAGAVDRQIISANQTSRGCAPDYNCSGQLEIADIFSFLSAWLAADDRADFDGINGLQVADIFEFLNAWLSGCP